MVGRAFRVERNRMLPSGVHPWTSSMDGWKVIRLGVPPSEGITYTSLLPSYSAVNAIHFPSLEKRGSDSLPTPLVRRWASPPLREAFQRSLACTNTTELLLKVGSRNNNVPSWDSSCAVASNAIPKIYIFLMGLV